MKQPRINVQTIAEVLIDELDKLEKTSKRIESVLPAVDERLNALQRTTVSLDTREAERILSHFESLTQRNEYYPRWVIIFTIAATAIGLIGLFFGFSQIGESDQLDEANRKLEIHQRYIQDTEQVEQFQEWIEKE
jgi:hypothetical protein